MMSTRKQGRGLATMHSQGSLGGDLPPSPLPMADLASVSLHLDAGGNDDGGSSLAEDEEYTVEEHAHRYTPSPLPLLLNPGLVGILGVVWAGCDRNLFLLGCCLFLLQYFTRTIC